MSPDDEEARRLLRKAGEDQTAVVRFATDPLIADAVIGFHAQQAVEKALKAVLAAAGDDFPWTHDLRHLLERLDASGSAVPDEIRRADGLTPWAVEFRYGETIDEALDRAETVRLVAEVVAWASGQVRPQAD